MLAAFRARTTRVSNPDRSPGFSPSPSNPFWSDAFAIGGPPGIITFYRSPRNTSDLSRFQVWQSVLHVDMLSRSISQNIYQTGYGRFRPNNDDSHSWRGCYRGGWHPSYPPLIRHDIYSWQKPILMHEHSGFPYHTCVHCKGFAPAAPRRARTSVSVSFWGLPLSRPLRIVGLVSRYLTNSLIRHRLILWRCLSGKTHSSSNPLSGLSLSFPRLSQTIS